MNKIRWCQRFPGYTFDTFWQMDTAEYNRGVVVLEAIDKADQHLRERAERRAKR